MQKSLKTGIQGRGKFIIGGLLILTAIIYLIVSATQANAEYFMTVNELKSKGNTMVGRSLRISGAVVGTTIQYDPQTMNLSFDIAHVPGDNAAIEMGGGLAAVLHAAVTDTTRARLTIIYNGPKPDLLRDEAQAIITGHLGEDGIFYADELLLKCPTKYQEAVPSQVSSGN
ncbi:MAG TPA: cytochrome c maturation protein CcmE [Anaerolineales bacterium]